MTRLGGAILSLALCLCVAAAPSSAATKHHHHHKANAKHHHAKAKHKKHKKKKTTHKKKPAATPQPAIVSRAVTFTVRNTNTSKVPCTPDGKTYQVKGHITGPTSKLSGSSPLATTLYVHGLGYGEFFWNFKDVPGYDYATAQADRGQISVTIDRLGYGASGKPNGNDVCYGSEADYLHQIIGQLRKGSYAIDGAAPKFAKIALAGHSAGGFMVEGEAVSYNDIDGLVLLAFSNTGISPGGLATFAGAQGRCLSGAAAPSNYTPFGDDATFAAQHFYDIDPAVAADVLKKNNPDPCMDTGSAPQNIVVDIASSSTVKRLPVLIVNGANDALFPPPAGQEEKSVFSGNKDVTQVTVPGTGHALTLGRSAPKVRGIIADWLVGHGY